MMLNGVTYFTSEDVARYFEVNPGTVRQWVYLDQITPEPEKVNVGYGKRILIFTEAEVTRFAQKRYGA